MKKAMSILALSAMVLMGCDSKEANAQNQGMAVGNSGSDNVLMMQEDYEAVVAPANNGNNPNYDGKAAMPSKASPAKPAAAKGDTMTIDETVSGVVDENGDGVYEVDESVSD